MRPYWAIVKDSFREAIQSRVLLLLLSITTVLLLGLAPIGIHEQLGGYFLAADLLDQKGLLEQIQRQRKADKPSPGKQAWGLFSEEFRSRLEGGDAAGKKSQPRIELAMPKELNRVINSRSLYSEAAWANVHLNRQVQELLDRGVDRLSAEQLSHLNRLLLEAAYPGKIAHSRPASSYVSYMGWRFDGSFPMTKRELVGLIIRAFTQVFVGWIGILVAVLATASIMPQTFAPGAIDLLLSKPISRSLLYVTKYVGGCAFTLVNASYVLVGLWLIAGVRFGEWSNNLLLCIPIFMFLFAIYYAVSALAGVVWRNPIISVVLTVLFWAICLGLGATKSIVEGVWIEPERFVAVLPAGDALMAANRSGQAFRWDERAGEWVEILTSPGEHNRRSFFEFTPSLVGPVYDPQHERVLAIQSPYAEFGAMPGNNLLRIGQRADDWQLIMGVAVPAGTAQLFIEPRGGLLAVGTQGIFRLQGDPAEKPKQMEVFGFKVPAAGQGTKFALVSPALRLHSPLAAAMDKSDGAIAVFDGQTLAILSPDESSKYSIRERRKLDFDERGVVAFAGKTVLIGLLDGRILIFDRGDLKPGAEFEPHGSDSVRAAAASPDGRYFAVVFADRKLWLYDVQAQQPIETSALTRRDASAVTFATPDQLLVAEGLTRVIELHLPDGAVLRRYSPPRSYMHLADEFLLTPLYTVFPKPSELSSLVNELLSDEKRAPARLRPRQREEKVVPKDVWGPLWSNLAFIAVAVALGCAYTSRKDF